MSEELIKNFTQLGKGDAAIAGGKGASLGEMTSAGIPVPPGFVILSDAFERFLEETDLNAEIDAALHSVNREEMHTVERASATIQQMILSAKMPEDIAKEIEREFAKLSTQFVAVRSSATAEDSASAAWAGQLDSFLNTTEDSLLQNVQRCWASLFTPRAIFYRFEKNLHLTKISVAVVVQKMVASEVSGIAFSVHPVTEDHNQLIIEAGFGLGEAIVSGQVTPDSYVVEKTPRRIIDTNISTQTRQLIRSNNKVDEPNAWVEIPEPQASSQVLSEAQILELSELILKIENHYNFPCDIEWAFEANTFYIVQSRPITTLSPLVANFQSNLAFLKPENFSYVGLYKSPPFSLWFWSAWYQKDLADELNVPHEPDIYFGFKGGHTFTRNSSEAEFRNVVTERVNSGDISYFKNLCSALEREAKTAVAFAVTLEGHPITHEEFDYFVYWGRRLLFFCFVAWQNSQQFDPLFKLAAAEEGIDKDMVGDYIPAPRTLLTQQHEESLELKALLEQKGLWELLKQDSSQAIKAIRSDNEIWPLVESHLKKFEWLNLMNWIGDKLSLEKLLEQMTLMSSTTNSASPVVSTAFEKYVSIATEVAHLRNAGVEQLSIFTNKVMPTLMELAQRGGVSYRDFLLLMPTEVFKDGQRALDWQEKISRRQNDNWCIYNDATGAIKIEDDVPSVEEIAERFLPKYKKDISDGLRGQIGNKGKAIGPVRVIIATDDFHKMQTGDVLVTPMTTPDFVLLMQKSAAIVTDMGGLLCHAAIVSRELNKPCVIDTKFATQVLKDGDLVEVDANTGIIRILQTGNSSSLNTHDDFFKRFRLDTYEDWNEQGRWILPPFVGSALSYHHMDSEYAKEIFPGIQLKSFFYLDYYAFQLKEDKEHILQYLKKLYFENGLEELYKKIDGLGTKLILSLKNELEKDEAYKREHLASILSLYRDLNDFWLIQSYVGDACIEVAKEVAYVDSDAELFGKVQPFLRDTWIERETKDAIVIAKMCLEKFGTQSVTEDNVANDVEIGSLLEKYLNDYSWSKISWWIGEKINTAHAIERINQEIKNIQECNHISTHKEVNAKMDGLVGISVSSSFWRAEGGMMVMMAGEKLGFVFDEIAQVNTISKEEALLLTLLEVHSLALKKDMHIADLGSVLLRKEGYFLIGDNAGSEIVFGKNDARYAVLQKTFILAPVQVEDILKGIAASPGKARGLVRVIQSAQEFNTFLEGEILVSVETSPMFVPLMRKAVAILTGKGGITSHAAIVSRELKKPCIIAIKDIVKILKTGDLVEVDADKGEVQIIEKAHE